MDSKKGCCDTKSDCGCGASNCDCGSGCNCNKCTETRNSWTLGIRKHAPFFECAAYYNGIKKINLHDFKGKYLVLFFYPLDFTFVCPTEIVQFSDRAKEFRDIGCEVVGASVDSVFSHMEYTKKDRKKGGLGKMDIPLLADVTKELAKAYGCLCDVGDDKGVTYRATYIIDKNQILRHYTISDLPVGRSVDEVLRLVKAFQYTDEYGEVCPSGWKPGAPTMVADPNSDKTAQYWESEHGKGQ